MGGLLGPTEETIRSRLRDKPLVVICGGGYGGVELAKHLDSDFNVLLIDRKNYFFHNIGALRSAVTPDFLKAVIIPYTNILKYGSIIQAEIMKVTREGVFVAGREEPIPYKYCVISTGSSYSFPAKVGDPNADDLPPLYQQVSEVIRDSRAPLIIGGGPVGLELLGEIMTAHPDKNLTLVHNRDHVLTDYFPDKLRNELETRIANTHPNARLVLGARAELSEDLQGRMRYFQGERIIPLSNGETIETDLVIFCGGAKINSRIYEEEFGDRMNERNQIRTNEHLIVENETNIFAMGDCCIHSNNFAWVASEHSKVITQNIKAMESGESPTATVPEYWKICITPLGPNDGASLLPFGVVGGYMTSFLKGKDLATGTFWRSLGFPGVPEEFLGANESEMKEEDGGESATERLTRMAAASGMESGDVARLLEGFGKDVPAPAAEDEHT